MNKRGFSKEEFHAKNGYYTKKEHSFEVSLGFL
jgi:hypothetical protein